MENEPKPMVPAPAPAPDPNAVIVGSMVEKMSAAFVERDRTVETEHTKRMQIEATVTQTALWIAGGLLVVMLALGAYAFHEGEKSLLGQVCSGTFGFLAGFGYSKIFSKK